MSINLLKTYYDMIRHCKTTQRDIDDVNNAIYVEYFLKPDLRLNQRAGRDSRGEFIEGNHIYPDIDCIRELLNSMQTYLDAHKEVLEHPENVDLGMIRYMSQLATFFVKQYFGSTENVENIEHIFYDEVGAGTKMAKLSDFKGKNCAECIERTLATHIILCVLSNDEEIKRKGLFPYTPFMHFTNYCAHIDRNAGSGGHAVCGLISQGENNKKVYILDPTNLGSIRDATGQKNILGLYELTSDEAITLFQGGAIAPQLIYSKNYNGVTQLSHRAFSRKAYEFNNLHKRYNNISR